jgi:LysM repeat protein
MGLYTKVLKEGIKNKDKIKEALPKITKIIKGLRSNKKVIKQTEGQIKKLAKENTKNKKFAGFSNPKKLNSAKKKLTKLEAADKKRIATLRKGGYAAAGVTTGGIALDALLDKVLKDKGTTPPVKTKSSSVTIKKGDTLSQIAKANGTTLKALQEANPGIKDLNKIRIGQKINLSPKVKDRKSVYQGMSKSDMAAISKNKSPEVVARKYGGQIGRPRGVGAALRGYGKGYK